MAAVNRLTPNNVNLFSKRVSCGANFTVCVGGFWYGKVYGWGDNEHGQLGETNYILRSPTIIQGTEDLDIISVSCGVHHTILIGRDGDVYALGQNDHGQLGIDNGDANDDTNIPTQIRFDPDVKIIAASCGSLHTILIADNGNAYSFGSNQFGQLGFDDTGDFNRPIQINLPDIKFVGASCGNFHSMLIDENGYLYTFGANSSGQLGRDIILRSPTPTRVVNGLPNNIPITDASGGLAHTVVRDLNGNVYSFGTNTSGQLGLGNNTNTYVPTKVEGEIRGVPILGIGCGNQHTILVADNGNVYTCGQNNGRLGLGDYNNRNSPTRIMDTLPTNIINTDGGNEHTVFLTTDGFVYTCGDNGKDQLGIYHNIHKVNRANCFGTMVNARSDEQCHRFMFQCFLNADTEGCVTFLEDREFFDTDRELINTMHPILALRFLQVLGFLRYNIFDPLLGINVRRIESVNHWIENRLHINDDQFQRAIMANDNLLIYLNHIVDYVNNHPEILNRQLYINNSNVPILIPDFKMISAIKSARKI